MLGVSNFSTTRYIGIKSWVKRTAGDDEGSSKKVASYSRFPIHFGLCSIHYLASQLDKVLYSLVLRFFQSQKLFTLNRTQSNLRQVEKQILDSIIGDIKMYDSRIRPSGNKTQDVGKITGMGMFYFILFNILVTLDISFYTSILLWKYRKCFWNGKSSSDSELQKLHEFSKIYEEGMKYASSNF